mmetsp:Transcript_68453/g.107877  ORF Transcript_68453/g.107877 Transcript_68453/m.107877 type:complete len:283 (+) Transcript_68453:723-1571(+)
MSTSWKVVRSAALFCASFKRVATILRTRDIGTLRSPRPVAVTFVVPAAVGVSTTGAGAMDGGSAAGSFPARMAAARRRPALNPTTGLLKSISGVLEVADADGAGVGVDAAAGAPVGASPTSTFINVAPTSTVSSTFATISLTIPDSRAFTSTVTLSVSIVHMTSPFVTPSPTFLAISMMVPSVMDSAPNPGTFSSIIEPTAANCRLSCNNDRLILPEPAGADPTTLPSGRHSAACLDKKDALRASNTFLVALFEMLRATDAPHRGGNMAIMFPLYGSKMFET